MRKSIQYFLWSIVILQTFSLLFLWYSKPKNAWVNIQNVYKDFEYKKELQAKLETTQNARKFILDSMELELKAIQSQLQKAGKIERELMTIFEARKETYLSKRNLFEEDNAMMVKKFDEQIITQLNQYIKDYGEKHCYNYIYGADGTGTLMYADKGEDITEAIKEYVNRRFEGKTE